MRKLEARIEARIDRKMQHMNAKMREFLSAHKDSDAQNNDQDCDLTIEKLELSLGEMERRLEDKINRQIQSLNEKFEEISSTHASVTTGHAHRASRNGLEQRVVSVGNTLDSIAEAVGVTVEANAGDDDADRKRLKEKLKEALEAEGNEGTARRDAKEPWLEYIFGICKPDGRMGKRGSR